MTQPNRSLNSRRLAAGHFATLTAHVTANARVQFALARILLANV
jgi:hypothetical protein